MLTLLIILVALLFMGSPSTNTSASQSNDGWRLVFSDEFNQPDGSQPDPKKWNRADRGVATWSRWISKSEKVVYIKDGNLVCRAVPNRYEPTDTARMLTGAINTKGKFTFTYGKVEVRMKVKLRDGSFPAAWLQGAQTKRPDWYKEIDIVEVFGGQRVFHSAFTHLAVKTGRKDGPQNVFKNELRVDQWHVYGVEWTPTAVTWTIDGRPVATYKKSSNPDLLKDGQWPYDYPMYIILNQSLGDSTWKKGPLMNRTYETRFDWIRVYQR